MNLLGLSLSLQEGRQRKQQHPNPKRQMKEQRQNKVKRFFSHPQYSCHQRNNNHTTNLLYHCNEGLEGKIICAKTNNGKSQKGEPILMHFVVSMSLLSQFLLRLFLPRQQQQQQQQWQKKQIPQKVWPFAQTTKSFRQIFIFGFFCSFLSRTAGLAPLSRWATSRPTTITSLAENELMRRLTRRFPHYRSSSSMPFLFAVKSNRNHHLRSCWKWQKSGTTSWSSTNLDYDNIAISRQKGWKNSNGYNFGSRYRSRFVVPLNCRHCSNNYDVSRRLHPKPVRNRVYISSSSSLSLSPSSLAMPEEPFSGGTNKDGLEETSTVDTAIGVVDVTLDSTITNNNDTHATSTSSILLRLSVQYFLESILNGTVKMSDITDNKNFTQAQPQQHQQHDHVREFQDRAPKETSSQKIAKVKTTSINESLSLDKDNHRIVLQNDDNHFNAVYETNDERNNNSTSDSKAVLSLHGTNVTQSNVNDWDNVTTMVDRTVHLTDSTGISVVPNTTSNTSTTTFTTLLDNLDKTANKIFVSRNMSLSPVESSSILNDWDTLDDTTPSTLPRVTDQMSNDAQQQRQQEQQEIFDDDFTASLTMSNNSSAAATVTSLVSIASSATENDYQGIDDNFDKNDKENTENVDDNVDITRMYYAKKDVVFVIPAKEQALMSSLQQPPQLTSTNDDVVGITSKTNINKMVAPSDTVNEKTLKSSLQPPPQLTSNYNEVIGIASKTNMNKKATTSSGNTVNDSIKLEYYRKLIQGVKTESKNNQNKRQFEQQTKPIILQNPNAEISKKIPYRPTIPVSTTISKSNNKNKKIKSNKSHLQQLQSNNLLLPSQKLFLKKSLNEERKRLLAQEKRRQSWMPQNQAQQELQEASVNNNDTITTKDPLPRTQKISSSKKPAAANRPTTLKIPSSNVSRRKSYPIIPERLLNKTKITIQNQNLPQRSNSTSNRNSQLSRSGVRNKVIFDDDERSQVDKTAVNPQGIRRSQQQISRDGIFGHNRTVGTTTTTSPKHHSVKTQENINTPTSSGSTSSQTISTSTAISNATAANPALLEFNSVKNITDNDEEIGLLGEKIQFLIHRLSDVLK